MVRSDVSVLVDSVVQSLKPKELVLFLQSFGIPTASMSKLLHALDSAVQVRCGKDQVSNAPHIFVHFARLFCAPS